jgi:hypothetical protein
MPYKGKFVYLAYVDDSDTKQKSAPWQVMAAVLVRDASFRGLEVIMSLLADELMQTEEDPSQFEEFHACELYGGYGAFSNIPQEKRFHTIKSLLDFVVYDECSVIYGAVYLPVFYQMIYGAAEPMDVSFRICMTGITKWMIANSKEQLEEYYRSRKASGEAPQKFDDMALLIVDDCDKAVRATLQKSFRQMRSPFRSSSVTSQAIDCIHDDMYFGDSKFSVGIQIADLCSFFIAKHLIGDDPAAEAFYQIIAPRIVYSKEVPERGQQRNDAKPIGISE